VALHLAFNCNAARAASFSLTKLSLEKIFKRKLIPSNVVQFSVLFAACLLLLFIKDFTT